MCCLHKKATSLFDILRKGLSRQIVSCSNKYSILRKTNREKIMVVLTNPKLLTGLSQIDLLLSFILFIIENLIPYPDSKIHALIIASSTSSVFLSLVEMYSLGKREYSFLLCATLFRLGPVVSISILWMVCSKR